jgi:hypothetical protein
VFVVESRNLSITNTHTQKKKQENLKILKQYTKLLAQACHHHDHATITAHAQPLSPTPTSYPRNLAWFEPLAKPCDGLDEENDRRVDQLLELHHAACHPAVATPRQHAFLLAKTLPHFDRDLTATYLRPALGAPEYELHVAHSILRLHNPQTLEDLQIHLETWRSQGLLHVLGVAALNMPDLADWFPVNTPDEHTDECARSLLYCIGALRSRPASHTEIIESFITTQNPEKPTAQSIATTLDRLAVLMGVKSNAVDEPDHVLSSALASFPHLDSLDPQDVWHRLKPALEASIPPSVLRLDPASARKRVKQAHGSW